MKTAQEIGRIIRAKHARMAEDLDSGYPDVKRQAVYWCQALEWLARECEITLERQECVLCGGREVVMHPEYEKLVCESGETCQFRMLRRHIATGERP
jgi:hypothetical protein